MTGSRFLFSTIVLFMVAIWPAQAEMAAPMSDELGVSSDSTIVAWKDYAAQTGDSGHKEWVALISSPKAVALAADWRALRGYDATSLLAKETLPPELKPGLVITADNVASMPWLKDYLDPEMIERLGADWFPIHEIRVVPTNHYYMSRGKLSATKAVIESRGKFTVNGKGELIAPDGSLGALTSAALPFIEPKNGLELEWQFVTHSVGTDNLFFHPLAMDVCNSSGQLERSYEAHLWWKRFHGRTDMEPLGDIKGKKEVIEGGSIFFLKPFDVRGLTGVRQRFAAADRDDEFVVFIPSLRRTRILSGSDAQDPLAAGVEVTWDEWRAYWQKTDPENFDYKMTGEKIVLAQPEMGAVGRNITFTEDGCGIASIEMELRPVWVLEQTDKSGKYQYSKRINYVDKELYYTQYSRMYDRRDNLFRTWGDSRTWNPETGLASWSVGFVPNWVSNRVTFFHMTMDWDRTEKQTPTTRFDVDQLRDYR